MRRNANYFNLFSKYLKKVKIIIVTLMLFSLVLSALQLIFPILWGNIICNLISVSSIEYSIIVKYLIIYIVLEFIEGILTIIKNTLYSTMEEKMTKELKDDMINKMLGLELKAFDKNRVSFFTHKITEDTHVLIASFMKLIYTAISILKLIALFVITFSMSKYMSLVFIVASIIVYTVIYLLKPFENKTNRFLNNQIKEYTNNLYSDVRAIREIKTLGIKKQLRKQWEDNNNDITQKIASTKGTNNLIDLLTFTLKYSMHSIVLVFGAYLLYINKITFIALIVFELYSIVAFNVAKSLTTVKETYFTYKSSLKAVFDLLSNKSYENEKYGSRDELDTTETLIIKNLSFAYGNSSNMLLDDLCFEIEFGKKVAIVDMGENTKHIFANLLMRLYEPTEGRIMIGKVNIKEISEKSLRRIISYVNSTPYIINDTVENNLRLVCPKASMTEVKDAIRRANICEWFKNYDMDAILSLELGINGYKPTEVQCQQLAIARAMLLKSSIVIIDELNADAEIEEMYSLTKAVDNLENATVIMLSENITQLTSCDEIITLKDSIVSNIAGREEIVKNKNIYSKLAEIDRQKKELENVARRIERENSENNDSDSDNENKKIKITKGSKTVNAYKGENNEEHRIFSQIW